MTHNIDAQYYKIIQLYLTNGVYESIVAQYQAHSIPKNYLNVAFQYLFRNNSIDLISGKLFTV